MKMICSKNRGYRWFQNENSFFKGYIQLDDYTVLRDDMAVSFFCNCSSFSDFKNKLKNCYGCFAIALMKSDTVWAATDIARSIPLYFSADCSFISDSSECIRKKMNIDKDAYSPIRLLEMYEISYILGTNTCYDMIKQLDLGMAMECKNNSIALSYYYTHTSEIVQRDEGEIFALLQAKTNKMLDRIVSVVGNRQICISLSGGYDSRYLACSLKEYGINNVICYTYGRKDSFEVQQSKKVADALGYKWLCIENSDDEVKKIIKDNNYFEYCTEHDFTIYIQNYVAVKKLIDNKLIPEDSVFLTGLCNDMTTGAYIPSEEKVQKYSKSITGVADYIVDTSFFQFPITDEARRLYVEDIVELLKMKNINVNDYCSFIKASISLETGGIHSRWYLNMNRPHEFFGKEWLLPCWDRELLDFWYSVPINYRINQSLYEEYVTRILASKYGVGNKKTVLKTGITLRAKIKRKIGGFIVPFAYRMRIPLKRKTDFNNFAPLEVILYNQISQKRGVKSERAAIRLLLMIYVGETRYGNDFYSKIKQYLKYQ